MPIHRHNPTNQLTPNTLKHPPIHTHNTQGDEARAREAFQEMRRGYNIDPDAISYTTCIQACGRVRLRLGSGLVVVRRLRLGRSRMRTLFFLIPPCLSTPTPDVSFSAHQPQKQTQTAETAGQDWESALKLLEAAERDPAVAATKDSRLYTTAMRVCGAAGKRDKVRTLPTCWDGWWWWWIWVVVWALV